MTTEAKEALERHYRHIDPDWEVKKRLLVGDSVQEVAQDLQKETSEVQRVFQHIAVTLGVIPKASY